MMNKITVFCGSSSGKDDVFMSQAYLLGQALAENNIGLVYGGAKVGLMGAVANGALSKDGNVIGVLPGFLRTKEVAHEDLTELIITKDMHERKTIMNDLSDGIIALPGGFGTLEELFEMLTWAQLQLHSKPVAILNIGGYYDALLELIQTMVDKGFLREVNQNMLLVSDNIEELLVKMAQYKAPDDPKWIKD